MTKKAIKELVDQIILSKKTQFTDADRTMLESLPPDVLIKMIPVSRQKAFTQLDAIFMATTTDPSTIKDLLEQAAALYLERNQKAIKPDVLKKTFNWTKIVLTEANTNRKAAETLTTLK